MPNFQMARPLSLGALFLLFACDSGRSSGRLAAAGRDAAVSLVDASHADGVDAELPMGPVDGGKPDARVNAGIDAGADLDGGHEAEGGSRATDGGPDSGGPETGPHFAQVAQYQPVDSLGFVALDQGTVISVGQRFRAFRLPDLQTPVYDQPFFSAELDVVEFEAGTLIISLYGDDELIIYDLSDPTLGPVERGRIKPAHYPDSWLAKDGKRLFIEQTSDVDQMQIEIWDLSDRSAPRQVGTVATDCNGGNLDVAGDWLVVTGCGKSYPPNAGTSFSIYDIADPAQPARLVYVGESVSDTYLGIRDRQVYLNRANHVVRMPLSATGIGGLGTPESVAVPTENSQHAQHWGFRNAGPYYSETPLNGPDAATLCRFSDDGLAGTCFSKLLRDDELRSTYSLLADGSDVLLLGLEFMRHVDMSDASKPKQGQRRVAPLYVEPVAVTANKLIVTTRTGVATLDADTLQRLDFAPQHREVVYTGAADSDSAYVFDHDGQLGVFAIASDGTLTRVQRADFGAGAVKALLTQRSGNPYGYLVVRTSEGVASAKLLKDGTFFSYANSEQYHSVFDIVDNGTELFAAVMNASGNRRVVNQVIGSASEPTPRSITAKTVPVISLSATATELYIAMNELRRVNLASGEQTTITSPSDVRSLCGTGDQTLAIHYDGSISAVAGNALRGLTIHGLSSSNQVWDTSVCSKDRLILQASDALVSVKLTEH